MRIAGTGNRSPEAEPVRPNRRRMDETVRGAKETHRNRPGPASCD